MFRALTKRSSLTIRTILNTTLKKFPSRVLSRKQRMATSLQLINFSHINISNLQTNINRLHTILTNNTRHSLIIHFSTRIVTRLTHPNPINMIHTTKRRRHSLPNLHRTLRSNRMKNLNHNNSRNTVSHSIPLINSIATAINSITCTTFTVNTHIHLMRTSYHHFVNIRRMVNYHPVVSRNRHPQNLSRIHQRNTISRKNRTISVRRRLTITTNLINTIKISRNLPLTVNVGRSPTFIKVKPPNIRLTFSHVNLKRLIPLTPHVITSILMVK